MPATNIALAASFVIFYLLAAMISAVSRSDSLADLLWPPPPRSTEVSVELLDAVLFSEPWGDYASADSYYVWLE